MASPTAPKVLLDTVDYRLVENASGYHVEKRLGSDAMGMMRWSSVTCTELKKAYHNRFEAEEALAVPPDVFRAMCERIKEKLVGGQS